MKFNSLFNRPRFLNQMIFSGNDSSFFEILFPGRLTTAGDSFSTEDNETLIFTIS